MREDAKGCQGAASAPDLWVTWPHFGDQGGKLSTSHVWKTCPGWSGCCPLTTVLQGPSSVSPAPAVGTGSSVAGPEDGCSLVGSRRLEALLCKHISFTGRMVEGLP